MPGSSRKSTWRIFVDVGMYCKVSLPRIVHATGKGRGGKKKGKKGKKREGLRGMMMEVSASM